MKILLKIFHFAQNDKNFLRENSLPVLTYTANILWPALEVDENIVTRIFLTKNLRMKLTYAGVSLENTYIYSVSFPSQGTVGRAYWEGVWIRWSLKPHQSFWPCPIPTSKHRKLIRPMSLN